MNFRATCLWAVLLGAGCDEDPAPPADGGMDGGGMDAGDASVCRANGAMVFLGTGTDSTLMSYRALADGDGVYVVPGPQGGQHIWIGLRATGIDPSQPLIILRAIEPTTGTVVGLIRVRLRMTAAPEDPTRSALSNQTLVLDDDKYCAVLNGTVRVELELNDGAGHCVQTARTVRVQGIDPMARDLDRQARLACCAQRLPRCYPNGVPIPLDASRAD